MLGKSGNQILPDDFFIILYKYYINLDSNTLGSAALTPQEEIKIKKIEDATESARNELRNHHIYGVSLIFFRDFSGCAWIRQPRQICALPSSA